MKVIVAVALFAFVALQVTYGQSSHNDTSDDEEYPKKIILIEEPLEPTMSHGAPAPEEEKKEEPAPSPSPTPSEATPEAATPEVKLAAPSSDAPAAPVAAAAAGAAPAAAGTPAPAEDKKA